MKRNTIWCPSIVIFMAGIVMHVLACTAHAQMPALFDDFEYDPQAINASYESIQQSGHIFGANSWVTNESCPQSCVAMSRAWRLANWSDQAIPGARVELINIPGYRKLRLTLEEDANSGSLSRDPIVRSGFVTGEGTYHIRARFSDLHGLDGYNMYEAIWLQSPNQYRTCDGGGGDCTNHTLLGRPANLVNNTLVRDTWSEVDIEFNNFFTESLIQANVATISGKRHDSSGSHFNSSGNSNVIECVGKDPITYDPIYSPPGAACLDPQDPSKSLFGTRWWNYIISVQSDKVLFGMYSPGPISWWGGGTLNGIATWNKAITITSHTPTTTLTSLIAILWKQRSEAPDDFPFDLSMDVEWFYYTPVVYNDLMSADHDIRNHINTLRSNGIYRLNSTSYSTYNDVSGPNDPHQIFINGPYMHTSSSEEYIVSVEDAGAFFDMDVKYRIYDNYSWGPWTNVNGLAVNLPCYGQYAQIYAWREHVYVTSNTDSYTKTVKQGCGPGKQGSETALNPDHYFLGHNFPNPFNSITVIDFGLPESGNVRLVLYDALGRKIATPVNGFMSSGWHSVDFDASTLSTGIYYYALEAGTWREVKSMIVRQ